MSGIAGIVRFDGTVDPSLIVAMTDLMPHLGPDGANRWVGDSVALGHRMLRTTPESHHETQPLTNERGEVILVFDGRIDNREDLTSSLLSSGMQLRSESDPELVLRSYERWGEAFPEHLLGDFALAIWDKREQKLVLVRDAMRGKPLYYYSDDRGFAFASEMQPLFALPWVPRKPNLRLIGRYLCRQWDEPEQTLYEGIQRMPPAHVMAVQRGTLRRSRYWDIDPEYSIHYGNDQEYADHFREIFEDAVRVRMRSDRTVALTLSGGLDSSSIVCTAAKLASEKRISDVGFEAFSMVFDRFPCDERKYSKPVVDKWDVKWNPVHFEEHSSEWMTLDKRTRFPDIFYGPATFMTAAAFSQMQGRGIRVHLSGDGGDEIFATGFGHVTDLMRQLRFREMAKELQGRARIYETPPWQLFDAFCLRPLIPEMVKSALRPIARRLRASPVPDFVRADFVKRHDIQEELRRKVMVTKMKTQAQQLLYNATTITWNVTTAAELTDLMVGRFSIERRCPFFDRRLFQYVLALPEDQRWRGEISKLVLRNAMAGILPEVVSNRKGKAEFSLPMLYELAERQAQEVENLFANSQLAAFGIIDPARFMDAFRRYRREKNIYFSGMAQLVVGMELWCRAAVQPRHLQEAR